MNVKISSSQEKKGFYTVTPVGSIDSDTYVEFQKNIEPLLAPATRGILMDLEGVDYISSAGLGVLFSVKKSLLSHGGELLFCNLKPQIKRLFDIVKALPTQTIFENYEEADNYFYKIMEKEIESERNKKKTSE